MIVIDIVFKEKIKNKSSGKSKEKTKAEMRELT